MKISTSLIIVALSFPYNSFAIYGFNMPDSRLIKFHAEGACSLSVDGSINYLNMNYFIVNEKRGIEELLSDKDFFARENDEAYFVSEEVDDPKITIHNKSQQKTIPVSFNDLRRYMEQVEYFVQTLPNFDEKDKGYSLDVSCVFFAAGHEIKSFQTRFCVPKTKAGNKRLEQYLNVIKKITP